MGKVYEQIDARLADFIARQRMFFVATAPLAADGHVNLSPKGHDTLRVLGPREVAYLDLTGSGIETLAHLRENGRLTILFCAFEGPPKIVRLHGRGEVLPRGSDAFEALLPSFPPLAGARSIVRMHVTRVSDSCGFSVPRFDYREERTQLAEWTERKGDALATYRRERNAMSIDGLPGWTEGDEG